MLLVRGTKMIWDDLDLEKHDAPPSVPAAVFGRVESAISRTISCPP